MMIARGKKTKVRIIATADLPNGKAYRNDVADVAAGYARNYLIPQRFAVYATRENFRRLGLKDPELETVEERRLRLEREALATDDQDLKAADLLRHYLRNKTVRVSRACAFGATLWPLLHARSLTVFSSPYIVQLQIRRRVDPSDVNEMALSPSQVTAEDVRHKLSKQLRIDLEDHEKVHLRLEPLPDNTDPSQLEGYMDEFGAAVEEACATQVKRLGEFVARISLRGGHAVPLKVKVVNRAKPG